MLPLPVAPPEGSHTTGLALMEQPRSVGLLTPLWGQLSTNRKQELVDYSPPPGVQVDRLWRLHVLSQEPSVGLSPLAHSSNLLAFLSALYCLIYYLTASWDHLPHKIPVPKSCLRISFEKNPS